MFARSRKADPNCDERFTLQPTLDLCVKITEIREYTLDVAACAESAKALQFYTLAPGAPDGLKSPWFGDVWCNPPWSDLCSWVSKAWEEFEDPARRVRTISMLLPVRCEQPFWQELVEPYRDRHYGFTVHFLPKRQRFGSPSDPAGLEAGSPPFICCLLFWK
mgnify:FL=1